MNELIRDVDALLEKIAEKAVVRDSVEWYLHNNLNNYKAVLAANPSAHEIDNATRSLGRFCTESMDWDDPLYRECCSLTEKGAHLAKKKGQ